MNCLSPVFHSCFIPPNDARTKPQPFNSGTQTFTKNSPSKYFSHVSETQSALPTLLHQSEEKTLKNPKTTKMDLPIDPTPTKLEYFDDMLKLQSEATVLSHIQTDDGRQALILDSTIFHPQGGGQPSDTGFINIPNASFKFVVQDVRNKDGVVHHYGFVENVEGTDQLERKIECGTKIHLIVNEDRRNLNSRLHTAGHVLDVAICNVGLGHFTSGKAYHFPDAPFVEYKGSIPQPELQMKLEQLEKDVNDQILRGEKVLISILSYDEAAGICGGQLPDYIVKGSSPRIVKIGDNPGCPCGGTHVLDISEIKSMKISKIRSKKGLTRVFYNISV